MLWRLWSHRHCAVVTVTIAALAIWSVACSGGDQSQSGIQDAQPASTSAPTEAGNPVPGPSDRVTVDGLMTGGHVAWLKERELCPEEEFVSSTLDSDYVAPLGLESARETPSDLRVFLLEELSLDIDSVEHRWIVDNQLVLFKVTPWTDGEANIAASAVEVQRLTVAPGWAVSEAGFAFYCD